MVQKQTILPEAFVETTLQVMGQERFGRYLSSFDEEAPVSMRLNPLKLSGGTGDGQWQVVDGERVPWCHEGYYLTRRPGFTSDPLFHAGCYYVQEAASMFVSHVLRQHVHEPVVMLDLCAAPGGKSTAAIAVLPEGSMLYSNEPVRQRASILFENMTKWGYPGCVVTNNYPQDYRRSGLWFDVILCDVPCSGEGMFRKDEATIREWSVQNVEKCWRLQRDIVSDAWACLKDGGLLLYSTCTFNLKENEENVRWMCEELDAEMLSVKTQPEWNITGSLLPGFEGPVYRFIPGITRSEGLFMAVLRKKGEAKHQSHPKTSGLKLLTVNPDLSACQGRKEKHTAKAQPAVTCRVELSYPQAMAYLRHEALTLPEDTPHGIVDVGFMGHVLGKMKNIGTRANNLYPKEWKIRTTHVPDNYEAILKYVVSLIIWLTAFTVAEAQTFTIDTIPDAVFQRMKGYSYKANCTVKRSELRYLRLSHYDGNGNVQTGELVCNKLIANDLIEIFKELYRHEYPIERMQLVDDYDADDERSMQANNTSCFNFRNIEGSKKLSKHSLGMAIDINPLYNPCVIRRKDGTVVVQPATAQKHANRNRRGKYYITEYDLCYRLFRQHGFTWGGSWQSKKDYQHFER